MLCKAVCKYIYIFTSWTWEMFCEVWELIYVYVSRVEKSRIKSYNLKGRGINHT